MRWIRDVFGNTVGIVKFARPSDKLVFDSKVKVDHRPLRGLHLSPEDYAYLHPFAYDDEEMPDLARSIRRAFDDPERKIELWARQFVRSDGQTLTQDLLTDITHAIKRDFVYRRRHQPGVQEPLETLRTGMGTCRDFALFMIEAVRSLGYAARFVSGYLHVRSGDGDASAAARPMPGCRSICRAPAGSSSIRPTASSAISDLIRVAIAREPRQAVPLWGTYTGSAVRPPRHEGQHPRGIGNAELAMSRLPEGYPLVAEQPGFNESWLPQSQICERVNRNRLRASS